MPRLQGNGLGIALMILATASFTLNDSFLKLATEEVPPFQALAMRGLGSTILGLPLLFALGFGRHTGRMFEKRVSVRNGLELVCAMFSVVGLALVPLADLTALGQTSPLLLLLGAAVIFRERLSPIQIALIILAFIGALMVAQPGGSNFSPYVLLGLAAAATVAVRDLIGRGIPAEIPGLVIAVGAGAITTVGAGIAALLFDRLTMPSLPTVLFTLGSGAFLVAGHVLLLAAYRAASMSAVAPFLYMATVWALLAGMLIFGSVPNWLALLGIAVIVVSGIAVVALERWPKKANVPLELSP
ncbi:DMT family transporter [Devosia rhizoryzae]|uniref:DMT family transporter n=1 Tax=Devosia rhizoryzae TaxID=2774137 RepID=A0ABX7C3K6_9HYPH|nr:DMT family transporter [Devosia rhizoryzae]QQR38820.1 DMT family transporter [Devosia rhizoryzae]